MGNLSKIKKVSKIFHLLLSLYLIVLPLYYIIYWAFINHLPATFITVNIASTPLIPSPLSGSLQTIGFLVSLLPLSALLYAVMNIRKLFSFYRDGIIFSYEHVKIFKETAKALLFWVVLSIVYEAAKSVLFSISNPPGQRVLSVEFTSAEMTTLAAAGIIFVVAWVMDEGRILTEEQQLTV